MLDTYFFIPGIQKYLSKIETLKADYLVIDLEDAVSFDKKNEAFDLVASISVMDNYFVRIPFIDYTFSDQQLIKLIRHFEGRVVVPKLNTIEEFRRVINLVPELNLKMIILVENPLALLNLPDILKSFPTQVFAVGFGSHDFCAITGIKHTSNNLTHYKRQIILISKAFNIKYIDGVDTDLEDFTQFKNECIDAYEMGSDGKFLIHPMQLKSMGDIAYFSDEEWKQIETVYKKIVDIPDSSMDVYLIDGKVYEKPHINRIKLLMKKSKKLNT